MNWSSSSGYTYYKRRVENMGEIIAVSSNKGGILKSSLTLNASGVLAKQGKKILIIDTDSQANILLSFGKNPDQYENTLYDVLVDGFPIKDTIVNVHENIDVVPSNDDLSYFEMDVLRNVEKYPDFFTLLKNAMGDLKEEYDYIFVDTPPSMGLIVGNVFMISDHVLIPFHPETYGLRSMVKTIQTIQNFKKENPSLNIKAVIPTKVRGKTRVHGANLNACVEFCNLQGIKITESVIRETIKYADALAKYRLPLTLVEDAEEDIISDYVNLVKELNL